jgi:ligand-binding sensor domain-containing protein
MSVMTMVHPWMATDSQVKPWRFVPGEHLGKFATRAQINALFFAPNEELWASVHPGGAYYIDGQWQGLSDPQIIRYRRGTWRRESESEHERFMPVAWYHDQLWGIGPQGFARYEDDRWLVIAKCPVTHPWCFAVDQQYLWMGTVMQGLWRTRDGVNWEQLNQFRPNTTIGALWSDTAGYLLVTEFGPRHMIKPVYSYQGDQWATLPLPPRPRAFYNLCALAMDGNDRLWIGSSSTGVWRWAGGMWKHFGAVRSEAMPGLLSNAIGRVYVDRYDRVWAQSYAGIVVYADELWQPVLLAPGRISAEGTLSVSTTATYAVQSAYLDQHGRLWIGTADGQISWIDTNEALYPSPLAYPSVLYQAPLITTK